MYKINPRKDFQRAAKRLSKKYRSLPDELDELVQSLRATPTLGTPIGRGCYKIRLAIASKGRGKSSGGRIITYVAVVDETVYLLTMYDKAEQQDLTPGELDALLSELDAPAT